MSGRALAPGGGPAGLGGDRGADGSSKQRATVEEEVGTTRKVQELAMLGREAELGLVPSMQRHPIAVGWAPSRQGGDKVR